MKAPVRKEDGGARHKANEEELGCPLRWDLSVPGDERRREGGDERISITRDGDRAVRMRESLL